MHFFNEQAHIISNGDWLLNQEMHPYHEWHRILADLHYEGRAQPDPSLKPLQTGPDNTERNRALWNHWYGGKSFHQEPLFAYLQAGLIKLFGDRPWILSVIQSLAGLFSILLLYDIGKQLFNVQVARAAGILSVLYGPILFFESIPLRASLITFASLILVWVSILCRKRNHPVYWLILGFLCGFAVLLKSNLLLFPIGILTMILLECPKQWRRNIINGGIIYVGMALALTPLVFRNLHVDVHPLRLSSVAPITLLTANIPDSSTIGFSPLKPDVIRIMNETDGKVLPLLKETIKLHSVGSLFHLQLNKLKRIFHAFEPPNNTNYYYFRSYSSVLIILPISSSVILSLALPGLFLGLKQARARNQIPLLVILATHLATLLLVFVTARFRFPLVVCSIPFASLTLVHFYNQIRERKWRRSVILCGSTLILFAIMNRSLSPIHPKVRLQDIQLSLNHYYFPSVEAASLLNNPERVEYLWKQFFEHEPECVRQLDAQSVPESKDIKNMAELYLQVSEYYVKALENLNKQGNAEKVRLHAMDLAAAISNYEKLED